MKRFVIVLAASLCWLSPLYAQESRKYEVGAAAAYSLSIKRATANNYGFELYGGYKLNDYFSFGGGLNFVNYQSRALPSGMENVFVTTGMYRAFRPYVYCRYDLLPFSKWTPYAQVRLGYAFFKNSQLTYDVMYSYALFDESYNPADYEYLRDLDHTLGVKGGVYGAVELGASRHIGKKGGKISIGLFMELQPVRFEYNNHSERKTNITVGLKTGYTF